MDREYPLNCTEKNILAWERPGQAINSHFVLEFKNPLELKKLTLAVQNLFSQIPLLRTRIIETEHNANRKEIETNASLILNSLTVYDAHDEAKEAAFLERPFQLNEEPPLRIYYCSQPDHLKLIMSLHHTAGDGAAQAYLVNEFLRAYQGLELTAWTRELLPFRFRDFLRRRVGLGQTLLAFITYVWGILTTKSVPAANFLDRPEPKTRTVCVLLNDLGETHFKKMKLKAGYSALGSHEFLLFAIARTTHRICEEKGESKNPVVLMVPLNYRFAFKLNHYFQNAAGMNRLVIPRSVLKSETAVPEFKKLLEQHLTLRKSFRVVFMAMLLNFVMSPNKLRQKIRAMDEDPKNAFASVLVSSSRLPSSVKIPSELGLTRIYGRGALFRSPGLGVILTGTKSEQTLVIEYLKDAFQLENVQKFREILLQELGLS